MYFNYSIIRLQYIGTQYFVYIYLLNYSLELEFISINKNNYIIVISTH